jgi:uncharacterized protein with beta-barrel porin domain
LNSGQVARQALRRYVARTTCGFAALCVTSVAFAPFAEAASSGPSSRIDASDGATGIAVPAALFDIGTQFLHRLGKEATSGFNGPPLTNSPQGGGADAPAVARYRTWFESYGITSRANAQGEFPGDQRKTWGGVAGIGMTPTPGMSFGLSVDRNWTKVDVSALPQGGMIELTQIGINATFESGPWVFALVGIHGFGHVNAQREVSGLSTASYDARLWGGLAELDYLWSAGHLRIVPKIGADWTYTNTDAFTETGGTLPVSGSALSGHRTRLYAGAEVGYTWVYEHLLFDLSGYGRVVDIVEQDLGALQLSAATGTAIPRLVQGVAESPLGFDAGAAASWRVSSAARFYALYDGRYRGNFIAHVGTIGLEWRW